MSPSLVVSSNSEGNIVLNSFQREESGMPSFATTKRPMLARAKARESPSTLRASAFWASDRLILVPRRCRRSA